MSKENELADDRKPWTRQPWETSKQWDAFRHYRNEGLGRTVANAFDKYADKHDLDGDKPHQRFHQWRKENRWKERANAWDRYKDRQHQQQVMEARTEAIQQMSRRAEELAQVLVGLAAGQFGDDDSGRQDRVQLEAVREVFDRLGIDTPEQVEIDATVSTDQDVEHSFDVGQALEDLDADELDTAEKLLDKLLG